MAIIFKPSDTAMQCVVCGRTVKPVHATAAGYYADHRQAFAHSTHLDEPSAYLRAWAVFVAKEAADPHQQWLRHPTGDHPHVETLTVRGKRDFVRHLPQRLGTGRIVIVHDGREDGYYSALRKQWKLYVAYARRQFAGTTEREALGRLVDLMEGARFTAKPPDREPQADVHVVSAAELPSPPADCMTYYTLVPSAIPTDYLSVTPPGALIVQCQLREQAAKKLDVVEHGQRYHFGIYD